MRISDKSLGYLTLVILLAVGAWIAGLMVMKSHQATTHIVVLFDEMGSLQPEDPVTTYGFCIGSVGNVEWVDGKARVEILFNEPTVIHQDISIRNENYSLMGQRRVEITMNRRSPVADPDQIFSGVFEPGIAEAMHLMAGIRQQMNTIQALVYLLRDGDSTQASIPQITRTLLNESENILQEVDHSLTKLQPQVQQILAQTQTLTQQTMELSQQTDTTLKTLQAKGQLTIQQANHLMLSVQSSLLRLLTFIENLEQQPLYTNLMYKKQILEQVNQFVQTLQTVLRVFHDGKLQVTGPDGKPHGLSGLGNINLWGQTAREKARNRLKNPLDSNTD